MDEPALVFVDLIHDTPIRLGCNLQVSWVRIGLVFGKKKKGLFVRLRQKKKKNTFHFHKI